MSNRQYTKQLSLIDTQFKHYQPPPKYEPFIPQILNKTHQLILSTLTHHQKVLFVRADLRFPASTFNNSIWENYIPFSKAKCDPSVISRFQDALRIGIQNYVKRLSRSLTVINCLWVREVNSEYGYCVIT